MLAWMGLTTMEIRRNNLRTCAVQTSLRDRQWLSGGLFMTFLAAVSLIFGRCNYNLYTGGLAPACRRYSSWDFLEVSFR